jgi:peptide/nickel transport system substrate-binding protein
MLPVLQNQADIIDRVPSANVEWFRRHSKPDEVRVVDLGPELDQEVLLFNQQVVIDGATRKPIPPFVDQYKLKWFRNPKFRQAISHAINRRNIIDTVYTNDAEEAAGFVSTASAWVNTNVPQYHYDLAAARKLFAEIGMTNDADGLLHDSDGHQVEFSLSSGYGNAARILTSQLIVNDLAQVGIRAKLRKMDFEELSAEVYYSHGFECAIFLYGGMSTLPYDAALRSSSPQHVFHSRILADWEKHIDTLLDSQLRTMDPALQKAQWDEIQMIMAQQSPLIPTVSRYLYGAARPELANLRPSTATPFHLTWNLEELYYKEPPIRDPRGVALR